MKKYNKGFTLIELLVVIAIIGILASIVLVSLNTARSKGRDASASGSMSSVRAAAEIYFDTNNNNYDLVCTDVGSTLPALLNAASAQTGGPALWSDAGATVSCDSDASAYYAAVVLNDTTNDFCVDSTGFAGKIPTGTAGGTAFTCQ